MLRYLEQELVRVSPIITQQEFSEQWAYNGKLIPVTATLEPGITEIREYSQSIVGRAAQYNGVSKDIPLVNLTMTGHNYTVGTWVIGAEWNRFQLDQELTARNAGLLGRPDLVQSHLLACKELIGQWINRAIIFGAVNFQGFLNNSDVTLSLEATNVYALTNLQLFEYFRVLSASFRQTSLLTSSQLTLAVPPDLYSRLGGLMNDTNGLTAFGLLTSTSLGQSYGEIVELRELDSAVLESEGVQTAGTNRDRFLIYHKDPSTIIRETYSTRQTAPAVTIDGLHYGVSCYQGTSSVRVKKPYRIKYYSIQQPA